MLSTDRRLLAALFFSVLLHLSWAGLLAAPLTSWWNTSRPKVDVIEVGFVVPERSVAPAAPPKAVVTKAPRPLEADASREAVVTEPALESAPQATESVDETSVAGPPATNEEGRFLAELRRSIERRKSYPARARSRGEEGKVLVRLILKRDGHFEDLRVDSSSNSEILDRAALDLVRKIEGRYSIPSEIARDRWVLRVPVEFRLEGNE